MNLHPQLLRGLRALMSGGFVFCEDVLSLANLAFLAIYSTFSAYPQDLRPLSIHWRVTVYTANCPNFQCLRLSYALLPLSTVRKRGMVCDAQPHWHLLYPYIAALRSLPPPSKEPYLNIQVPGSTFQQFHFVSAMLLVLALYRSALEVLPWSGWWGPSTRCWAPLCSVRPCLLCQQTQKDGL